MRRDEIIYHDYVAEPHDTAPYPAMQYAYSCVTYTTGYKGVSDCEWIIPGTLEKAERTRTMMRNMRERDRHDGFDPVL